MRGSWIEETYTECPRSPDPIYIVNGSRLLRQTVAGNHDNRRISDHALHAVCVIVIYQTLKVETTIPHEIHTRIHCTQHGTYIRWYS